MKIGNNDLSDHDGGGEGDKDRTAEKCEDDGDERGKKP